MYGEWSNKDNYDYSEQLAALEFQRAYLEHYQQQEYKFKLDSDLKNIARMMNSSCELIIEVSLKSKKDDL